MFNIDNSLKYYMLYLKYYMLLRYYTCVTLKSHKI